MSGHFKKHTMLLLCTALMRAALFSHAELNAHQNDSFQSETVQTAVVKKNDTPIKKPTFKESWRKVLTLRWKELSKADAWNISAPVTGVTVLGLLSYYNLKNIMPGENNHNSDQNNPGDGANIPPVIAENNNDLNNNQDTTNSNMHGLQPLPKPALTQNTISDRNEIFVCDIQKNIALHMIADFLATPKILKGHQAEINAMAVNDDKLITASEEGSINVWNIHNGQLLHVLEKPDGKGGDRFEKSHKLKTSGNYVAIGPVGTTDKWKSKKIINIWNINTGELIHILEACDEIKSITMNQDKLIAGVGGPGNGKVMIWNIHSGALLHKFKGHNNRIMSIAIQDNILVTGSDDNTAKIWSINDCQLLHLLEGHTWWVNIVAIHDNKVITGSMDNTIKIWDGNNGQLLYTFEEHDGYINTLALSDNKVISGAEDCTIKIWDINTGEVLHTLIGHSKAIVKILINDDKIISTSRDSTRTWNINTGEKLYTIPHQKSNDWHHIITISRDTIITKTNNTLKIWPLYGDLNKPEFHDPDHALFWIKHNLLPLQANLIIRIWFINTRTTFFIDIGSDFNTLENTDDMYIWLTFPAHVRDYLMRQLNIRLIRAS